MDLTTTTLTLAVALGLLGFVEPCTIGAHLLFLEGQRRRAMRERLGAVTVFIVARLIVMGGFGGLIVVLGQRLIGVQTGAWLIFGAVYTALGAALLLGVGGQLRRSIGIAPAAWRAARAPWLQGAAFGLNIPACAAPILFGLIAAATAAHTAATGFALMATFALALSLPLVPLSVVPRLAQPLDRLADWLRPRRWLTGLVFLTLGAWSLWFGLVVDPADWAGS